MADANITIDKLEDNSAYIKFNRTGLIIYVDDSTEEELVTMWDSSNEKKDGLLSLPKENWDEAPLLEMEYDEWGFLRKYRKENK